MNTSVKVHGKVCLLKGGDSQEREISLLTAKECLLALSELGYDSHDYDFSGDVGELVDHLKTDPPDCVLNALHGGSGENGNVQALLNLMKIPYSHSGVAASAMAMDKRISRRLFASNGLRIPEGFVKKWDEFKANPTMDYPFVVKEIDGGSSAGVYVVNDVKALQAIEWKYKNNEVLVEKYIPGLELSVSVLNNNPVAVTNIVVSNGFYDYRNKYSTGCSFHEIPAKIPEKVRKLAMEYAMTAHAALGCRWISRSDFRYDHVADELCILEVNTQPGMTKLSLVPEQAKYVGISFNQLVQWIVEEACYDI
ncbi:MAG: D-alanine--D-alanine ligase [Holosporaceae bacterium]|jgi:D-alanine-D-alanine ligase|nr:D-alanine--D-alanine ligase [Holosporaceae bacterium]